MQTHTHKKEKLVKTVYEIVYCLVLFKLTQTRDTRREETLTEESLPLDWSVGISE